jgi:DNA-binding MarR family transcriptional regulator
MSSRSVRQDRERAEQIDLVAGQLLSRAALLLRLVGRQASRREMSRTEGEVLVVLCAGPRRVTELAELLGLAQPTMTLLVKRLRERGWVRREALPEDGRVAIIAITAEGEEAVVRFRGEIRQAMREDLERASKRQLEDLAAATETLGSFLADLQGPGPRPLT